MRLRITLVATSVVAVALVLGAVVFWLTLRASLFAELREAAEQDASAIAAQIEAGGGSSTGIDDDRLVQVVDDSGAVIAASEDAPRTSLADSADEVVQTDEGRFVIAVEGISGDGAGEHEHALHEPLETAALVEHGVGEFACGDALGVVTGDLGILPQHGER